MELWLPYNVMDILLSLQAVRIDKYLMFFKMYQGI